MKLDTSIPVLILGGTENALSLLRHFGRRGIRVSLSSPKDCWGRYSRYCSKFYPIESLDTAHEAWSDLLCNEADQQLRGHIIIPCSDSAIEFVAYNHQKLVPHYILDDAMPEQRLAMLDKRRTLELARAVGNDTSNFWMFPSSSDYRAVRDEITFPVMVKPVHSHKFTRVFGRKLFIIESDFDEMLEKVELAKRHGIDVMVMEMVPGPDDLLSSYYTYIDADGNHLFQFTKRVFRRHPVNRGGACYHITEWLPETAEQGRKFFDGIGFRGMGNIEFKRDLRDGKLKVIEVNARFTAAQELLVQSGMPSDLILYCHLTGQSLPEVIEYEQMLRFWYPLRDFLAFLELRKRGELTLLGWLQSTLPYRQVLPLFDLSDPLPVVHVMANSVRKIFNKLL